jgi:hypothetical protein
MTYLIRYKLTFNATDGTAKVQMFCFDTIAKHIIGKPCEFLVRNMNVSGGTPSELAAIIGLKFTFIVNININSYYAKERNFNVNSVIQAHGRQKESVDELTIAKQIQESPSTAMQKLSIGNQTSLVSSVSFTFLGIFILTHLVTMTPHIMLPDNCRRYLDP